ncbi:DUF6233 domain-containing protein [Streptomyces sp. NPDC050625]|uniref:DUF6233 domain-containing protein n=1 Tax=Streptomyces sp. NPDC050625 TaxID=3154629 RepID=UPI00343293FB
MPEGAPIFVILPDAQEVRGQLHARRQMKDGWLYQVGILVWQNDTNGSAEPAEQRVWVSPAHARPVPGVSYEHVPTRRPSGTDTASQERPPAWTLQYLPHRPGHPGATLLHVIGCTPSHRTLTREEALAALRQPRAAACIECDAARSLTPQTAADRPEPPEPTTTRRRIPAGHEPQRNASITAQLERATRQGTENSQRRRQLNTAGAGPRRQPTARQAAGANSPSRRSFYRRPSLWARRVPEMSEVWGCFGRW